MKHQAVNDWLPSFAENITTMSNPPRRRSQPKSDLSEEQITSIKETFAMFDPEKTGKMASKDLKVN